MARRTTDRRTLTADPSAACAAALLFFVHVLIGGFWMGAHAAPAGHDAFGNALCAWSGPAETDTPPAGHVPLPDCCAAGCSLAVGAPAADHAGSMLPFQSSARVAVSIHAEPLLKRIGRASLRSRGPPIGV